MLTRRNYWGIDVGAQRLIRTMLDDVVSKTTGEPVPLSRRLWTGSGDRFFQNISVNRKDPFVIEALRRKEAGQSPFHYPWDKAAEPKKVSVPSAQPGEAEYKTLKAEQEKNTVVAPAKRKARGSTIMDNPLATKSQGGAGTTYRKKLLGD